MECLKLNILEPDHPLVFPNKNKKFENIGEVY
jgi:hypothetical protein